MLCSENSPLVKAIMNCLHQGQNTERITMLLFSFLKYVKSLTSDQEDMPQQNIPYSGSRKLERKCLLPLRVSIMHEFDICPLVQRC